MIDPTMSSVEDCLFELEWFDAKVTCCKEGPDKMALGCSAIFCRPHLDL